MVYCARVDLSICFVCGQPNAFTLRFPIAPIMEKDAPVELSVMRAPQEVALLWPPGYSSTPVVGQPFKLTCPLEGDPPLSYSWKRYPTIDVENLEPIPLPLALTFGEANHSWEVESYSSHENGLYVCVGSNNLGSATYMNVREFFLNADKCSQHYQGTTNVHITVAGSPDGSPHHALGSPVTLHCTVSPLQKMRPGRPHWWRNGNGTAEPLPPTSVVQARYDGQSCTWHTSLTIPDISHELAGQYHCGVGGAEGNVTVSIKGSLSMLTIWWSFPLVLLVGLMAVYTWSISSPPASQMWWSVAQWAYEEPGDVDYLYDVFISSHTEASDLAHDIIFKGLEAWSPRGYRVCWHERDFLSGATVLQNISDAVHTSRKVVVILSRRFMESDFCRAELELALHRMHTSHTRCLIPITLDEDCVPLEVRRKITYWPLDSATKEGEGLLQKLTCLIGDPIEVHLKKSKVPSCAHG